MVCFSTFDVCKNTIEGFIYSVGIVCVTSVVLSLSILWFVVQFIFIGMLYCILVVLICPFTLFLLITIVCFTNVVFVYLDYELCTITSSVYLYENVDIKFSALDGRVSVITFIKCVQNI